MQSEISPRMGNAQNYMNPITTGEIAEAVGSSPNYLSRKSRQGASKRTRRRIVQGFPYGLSHRLSSRGPSGHPPG